MAAWSSLITKFRDHARTLPREGAMIVVVAVIITVTIVFMFSPGLCNVVAAAERAAEAARKRSVKSLSRSLGPERLTCEGFRDMDQWPVARVAEVEQQLPQLGRVDALLTSEHVPEADLAKYQCCRDAAKLTELEAELEAKNAARLRLIEAVQRGLGPARLQCACFRDIDQWPVARVAEVEQQLPQLGRVDALVESEHVPDPERAKYLCCRDAAKLTELEAELEAKKTARLQLVEDVVTDGTTATIPAAADADAPAQKMAASASGGSWDDTRDAEPVA